MVYHANDRCMDPQKPTSAEHVEHMERAQACLPRYRQMHNIFKW